MAHSPWCDRTSRRWPNELRVLREGDAVVAASGIADAVFVHAKRFVASARSRAEAMAMAAAAIGASADRPDAPRDGAAGRIGADTRASLMITRAQRAALRERGYTDEAIRTMTPAQAHGHLG